MAADPQLVGRRLLIVDDVEINRRILLHYTAQWGMIPSVTSSPAEALEWVHRGDSFDAALLDFHMPVMNGLMLAKQLRSSRSETSLPIMILSSATSDIQFEGVVTVALLKPIKPSRLLDELKNLFANNRQSATHSIMKAPFQRSLSQENPLRILVAEDNAVNQKVARLLFQRLGYSPDFAADGAEAIAAIDRQTYDVVFMDVQMPVLDGLNATREICRRWTVDQRPRIVAMTANASREDQLECQLSGMDDYVSKPVVPERIVEVISRCRRRDVA